jgi:hypothetical protein
MDDSNRKTIVINFIFKADSENLISSILEWEKSRKEETRQ